MIDYSALLTELDQTRLNRLGSPLQQAIAANLCTVRHKDLRVWLDALAALPALAPSHINLSDGVSIGGQADCTAAEHYALNGALRALMPWRKGPFNLFGLYIDTEWRSDWKWQRLLPHIAPLAGRYVLDVGAGNGYHCLRMYGAGAARVVGIDPSPRFVVQFYMLRKYLGDVPVDLLPLGIEALPANLAQFDTTFSMGVLYHRRSPLDHLRELKETLVPGGELVLETLIVDGPLGHSLVPVDRYAMMNNVWFIPTVPTLENWLTKMGFVNVRTVDVAPTSLAEQRQTDWMRFHSLGEFLDPNDPGKTVEGYPAPKRAIVLANRRA